MRHEAVANAGIHVIHGASPKCTERVVRKRKRCLSPNTAVVPVNCLVVIEHEMIIRLSRNHKPRELKVCFAEDLRTAVVQPKHLAVVACYSHTGRRSTRAVEPVLG